MATFVLVHGSWLGGWSWSRFRPRLLAAGHDVWAHSLTGLGDRRHLAAADVGLSTHIGDIVDLLRCEDLSEVILVGHSYGGMVVTGVAAAVPERIGQVVYVDAFVPQTGQSAFDILPWLRDAFANTAAAEPWAVAPFDFSALGVEDDADLRWITGLATAMPRKTHEEPVPPGSEEVLGTRPVTYLQCAAQPLMDAVAADVAGRGFRVVRLLGVGHLGLITHPEEITLELLAVLPRS
jgi:pimeloyl-ACP methyl ester carboxylesterase